MPENLLNRVERGESGFEVRSCCVKELVESIEADTEGAETGVLRALGLEVGVLAPEQASRSRSLLPQKARDLLQSRFGLFEVTIHTQDVRLQISLETRNRCN